MMNRIYASGQTYFTKQNFNLHFNKLLIALQENVAKYFVMEQSMTSFTDVRRV